MLDNEKRLVENVVVLRRKLAEAEARRGQQENKITPGTWQEFLDVSLCLEQAEERVHQHCSEMITEVNQVRVKIKQTLDEYNHWREQMRHLEDLFLANIVRPGHHLKAAIRQREFLESEYQRLLAGIRQEKYASLEELEVDLHLILARGNLAEETASKEEEQEELWEEESFKKIQGIRVDDVVEAFNREELIREFKRVVLPRVHPDTSNTSPEVFKTVFEVYKKADLLLMEALIAEYRGEKQMEKEGDILENLEQARKDLDYHLKLYSRLQNRLERLKSELTPQEMENPQKLEEELQAQRQEILARLRVEAEQILFWREKLEGLVAQYQQRHGQEKNDH